MTADALGPAATVSESRCVDADAIALVGESLARMRLGLTPRRGRRFTRCRASDFPAMELHRYRLVVLGDEAIPRVDPRIHARRLRVHRTEVWLVVDRVGARALVPWTREDLVTRTILQEEVADELAKTTMAYALPAIPAERLVGGTALSAQGRQLLEALAATAHHEVAAWAQNYGRTAAALCRDCKRHLGQTPRTILWRRNRAVVAIERGRGLTLEQIAPLLCYSDAATLARAFTVRGERTPRGSR